MTPLRQRMIQDMALRNLSPGTQKAYLRAVVGLSAYCNRKPPQMLDREQVRQYLVHLVQERHVSWGHYNQVRCGLRFFFGVTLGRKDADFGVPYPRQPKRLPSVLSQQQVRRFFAVIGNPRHRALFMLAYGAGLRVSEVVNLRVGDIHSDKMLIHVRNGKGRRERYACARWMEARAEELLPVEYFHVVFTLPDDFNRLCLSSPSVLYGILFDAAARTLLEVAANPKHLGARIGFLSILHTWGQNLSLHPHLHCVVPGGGLSHDGRRWVPCRPGFFLPVRILSKVPDAIRPRATHTALGFEGPSDLCPACGRGRMIKGRLLPRQPDLLILQTYWDTS